jgi:hypothetical protein
MKKLLIVGGAVTAAVFIAKRLGSSSGGPDFERLVERMPENAPPKWIYRNLSAIRENTERILQLLESGRTPAEGAGEAAGLQG